MSKPADHHQTYATPLPTQSGSVRLRLLAIALLPVLIVMPALLALATFWWSNEFDQLLSSKVNGDLTIARQYLNRITERSGEEIRSLGESSTFEQAVKFDNTTTIKDYLNDKRSVLGLDFLYIVDWQEASSRKYRSVIEAARSGRADTVLDVFEAGELRAISPELEKRAAIELVPTAAAVPINRTIETRGFVVHSAAPIRFGDGRPGALVGGILLNQNLAFIDTINDLVYKPASLPKGSEGTATLFLDDVRISTNVRLFANQRALGTRVSSAVRAAVLDEGSVWLDRAFVVNDWYISAYEPIVDSGGARVGMLYVGFLEKPFRDAKRFMLVAIVSAFAAITLLIVPLFLRWVSAIFRPLERMNETIRAVEAGDLGARTGPVASRDEIGRVSRHLDALLNRLQTRDQQLREWGQQLDSKVAERTAELASANERLKEAQQQLVLSEKLAAIGEIAAGVAHEINNPIAVIQGNLDVARQVLGDAARPVSIEFQLIDQQVHRMNLIVTKLLQFASPSEFAGYVDRILPDDVLNDSLVLVDHQINRSLISVRRISDARRAVLVNRTELQQVIINLVINAIHAMPEGGELRLATRDNDIDGIEGVLIEVADTGSGIDPQHLKKVFDAFFTTRPQRGTGLGLSISYSLIARYGGRMWVESELGKGATFFVWLPCAPVGFL